MIKVRVATLPEAGLELEEKLSAETVNQRLISAPDSNTNKIEFSDPISVSLRLEKVPHGMTAEGTIRAECSQICSRCAEPVSRPLECPIKHVFKHHTDPDTALPEEDIGVNYYKGEHAEIGPLLEDLLILNLSPYWHPKEDAAGNCSHCKLNLKTNKTSIKIGTQGLGEALKRAGVKSS